MSATSASQDNAGRYKVKDIADGIDQLLDWIEAAAPVDGGATTKASALAAMKEMSKILRASVELDAATPAKTARGDIAPSGTATTSC